jgi:hypothetical protein
MLLLVLLLLPVVARADGGAWLWLEYRVPLVGRPPSLPRLSLRIWSDTRFSAAAGGLAQQFLRVGPVMDVTSWFTLAAHATIYADRRPDQSFEQEARLEIEPTFQARLWHFTFSDRNRLEYRWREAHSRLRYRNQLRVNYAPLRQWWIPFAWDEVLVDLTEGFNENRFMAGVGFMLSSYIRLDAGYVLRTRRVPDGWDHDHLGVVYLFVNVPPKAKR